MEQLKIAIPNKGRLSEKIYALLNNAGLNFPAKSERTLQVTTNDGKYSLIFVRTQDIPKFVEDEVADIGFTGLDIVTETGANVEKIMDLDFGKCEMVVAVKEEDEFNSAKEPPTEIKVATSFPNIAKNYFDGIGKKAKIIEVSGATEITPRLGLSNVVVDITSSGTNLSTEQKTSTENLLVVLKSVIDAQEKKYLMANVPKASLEEIKSFLPGLSSPTVMTLMDDSEHVVIHVVVDADRVFDSIQHLKSLGGEGILIMTVDQMVK